MYSFFGLLYDNIGTLLCYIIMLLAKILIWAPFLQLLYTTLYLLTFVGSGKLTEVVNA